MMKHHCTRNLYQQENPDTQIYQIGGTSKLLIMATDGQFIMHCVKGGQIISIDACELCVIQLPCNCYLKASSPII